MNENDKALGVEADPYVLLIGGKRLLLSPITQEIKGSFVAWLKAKARSDLFAMREFMGEEEFQQDVADYRTLCLTGFYRFGGPLCMEVIGNLQSGGVTRLFHLMLREHQPKMTHDEAEEIFCLDPMAVNQAFKEMNASGKPTPPVEGTPGADSTTPTSR